MAQEIVVIDSQRLNMIQMCGYKYDNTFNKNLTPFSKPEAMERGDLLHTMLECYYSMHKYRDRWSANRPEMTKAQVIKILERCGEDHAIKMSLPIEEVDATFRVVREYIDYYWGEPFKTLAVENVGSKLLHEDDELVIIYETKIDWIVEMKNCPIMPVDHKSSKRRGETIAISNQFMGYCWMLGVSNLMVNKIGFQTTVKPEFKFSRPIMSYSRPVIEAWRVNSVYWIRKLLEYERTGFWPQNFTSCDKYSGCIFRPICEAPPETRSHTASQLFEIGQPWDVGAKL